MSIEIKDSEIYEWLDGAERDRMECGPDAYMLARELALTRKVYAMLCAREGLCPVAYFESLPDIGARAAEDFFTRMPKPAPVAT